MQLNLQGGQAISPWDAEPKGKSAQVNGATITLPEGPPGDPHKALQEGPPFQAPPTAPPLLWRGKVVDCRGFC